MSPEQALKDVSEVAHILSAGRALAGAMTPFYRLHSGGVVRNGAAALLVGPNGAGKTTLVLRLVNEGFSVLSDDEVWIDPESGLAHPTRRPLLLKESAWDLFPHHRDKFVDTGEQRMSIVVAQTGGSAALPARRSRRRSGE